MDYETLLIGFAVAIFVGFLANRFGYLSVHGKLKRTGAVGSGKGAGGADVKVKLH